MQSCGFFRSSPELLCALIGTAANCVRNGAFGNLPFDLRNEKVRCFILLGADMRLRRIILTACALLPLSAAAPGYSQSLRGELGAQSRASIHISVTVMPRFQLNASPREPSLSSNAPALRYSLVSLPLDGSSASPARANSAGKGATLDVRSGQGLLVLVVPD